MRTSLRTLRTLGLLALAAAPSCASDHSALGLKPHAAGMGGMGGSSPGAGGLAGRGGAITKPGTAGDAGIHPDKHVDPPGRAVFTVVHGVVDAELTAWCFARVRDGERQLVGDPVPPGGLAYGASLSFEALPHVELEGDGVVPFLITGDLGLIDGLDCADAVARAQAEMDAAEVPGGASGGTPGAGGETGLAGATGAGGESGQGSAGDTSAAGAAGAAGESTVPPPSLEPPKLRVGELPGLPPGTLAQGQSVLEVADGCFGARVFTHRLEQFACGFEYTPTRGSLSAEVVVLARSTVSDKLAMQGFHASRGTTRLGIRSMPSELEGGSPIPIIDNFSIGALRPREPRVDLPSASWGANIASWSVEATIDGTPYASTFWSSIRRRANIDELVDGRGYTVIAIGPSIEIEEVGWWNEFRFALVDNDPGVSEF